MNWTARLASVQPQVWLNRATPWVTFALLLLLAHALAGLTWRTVAPAGPEPGVAQRGDVERRAQAPRRDSGLAQVADLHLFGSAAEAPVVQEQAPIDVPETQLKLELRGVFASDVKENALAIIADAQGRESHYRIDAELPGNATLHEIYADKVILRRNGRLEALNLPTEREGIVVSKPAELPKFGARDKPQSAAPEPSGATANSLGELRDLFQSDPGKVWQQVRIMPHIEDGQIKGYRISHNNRRLMNQMGLRPDDIVTAVNGMPLTDPSNWQNLMSQLQSANQVSLEVLRRGQPTTLSVKIN